MHNCTPVIASRLSSGVAIQTTQSALLANPAYLYLVNPENPAIGALAPADNVDNIVFSVANPIRDQGGWRLSLHASPFRLGGAGGEIGAIPLVFDRAGNPAHETAFANDESIPMYDSYLFADGRGDPTRAGTPGTPSDPEDPPFGTFTWAMFNHDIKVKAGPGAHQPTGGTLTSPTEYQSVFTWTLELTPP